MVRVAIYVVYFKPMIHWMQHKGGNPNFYLTEIIYYLSRLINLTFFESETLLISVNKALRHFLGEYSPSSVGLEEKWMI
jgi:hypothetical protein